MVLAISDEYRAERQAPTTALAWTTSRKADEPESRSVSALLRHPPAERFPRPIESAIGKSGEGVVQGPLELWVGPAVGEIQITEQRRGGHPVERGRMCAGPLWAVQGESVTDTIRIAFPTGRWEGGRAKHSA